MKPNKLLIVVIALTVISAQALASGDSGTKYINEIYLYPDGIKIKSAEGNWDNPDSCGDSSSLFVASDHPQYDALLSLALTIQARGVRFRAYLAGCFTAGSTTYPKVWGISSYSN